MLPHLTSLKIANNAQVKSFCPRINIDLWDNYIKKSDTTRNIGP